MSFATVTSKGQVTIPVEVRRELKIEAGSKLEFILEGEGTFKVIPRKLSVMSLLGSIPSAGKIVSLEEMDEAIAAEATKGNSETETGECS